MRPRILQLAREHTREQPYLRHLTIATNALSKRVLLALLFLPLLSGCVVTDLLEDLPHIDSFESFMTAVLMVGLINLVYNLIVGLLFGGSDTVTEIIFFVLLISFSPYSFFMSLLITIVGRLIGFLLSLLLPLIVALIGRLFAKRS